MYIRINEDGELIIEVNEEHKTVKVGKNDFEELIETYQHKKYKEKIIAAFSEKNQPVPDDQELEILADCYEDRCEELCLSNNDILMQLICIDLDDIYEKAAQKSESNI